MAASKLKQKARSVIGSLAKSPMGRLVVSFGMSILATIESRVPTYIYFRNGYWHHCQGRRTTVDLRPRMSAVPKACDQRTLDNWLTHYTPKAGDVVIDVGAGVGDNVLLLSQLVGPEGKVYAIEAHPGTYACLQETCKRSNLGNVIAVNVAIHDSNDSVSISDEEENKSNRISASSSGTMVPGMTLDTFAGNASLTSIDLLKMNIEGAEGPAMTGMNHTLPLIRNLVISCHDFLADRGGAESNRTKQSVSECVVKAGFQIQNRTTDTRDYINFQVIGVRHISSNVVKTKAA